MYHLSTNIGVFSKCFQTYSVVSQAVSTNEIRCVKICNMLVVLSVIRFDQ